MANEQSGLRLDFPRSGYFRKAYLLFPRVEVFQGVAARLSTERVSVLRCQSEWLRLK